MVVAEEACPARLLRRLRQDCHEAEILLRSRRYPAFTRPDILREKVFCDRLIIAHRPLGQRRLDIHRARRLIDPNDIGHDGLERGQRGDRSEEHTSELQSLMRISYAVLILKKKKHSRKILR